MIYLFLLAILAKIIMWKTSDKGADKFNKILTNNQMIHLEILYSKEKIIKQNNVIGLSLLSHKRIIIDIYLLKIISFVFGPLLQLRLT